MEDLRVFHAPNGMGWRVTQAGVVVTQRYLAHCCIGACKAQGRSICMERCYRLEGLPDHAIVEGDPVAGWQDPLLPDRGA